MNQVSHLEDKGGEEEKGDEEDKDREKRLPAFLGEVKMSTEALMFCSRDWQTFSVKKQIENVLGSVGHSASSSTIQLCHYNRAAAVKKNYVNEQAWLFR